MNVHINLIKHSDLTGLKCKFEQNIVIRHIFKNIYTYPTKKGWQL